MKLIQSPLHNQKGFSAIQNIMIAVVVLILVSVGGYMFYGYIQSSYQVKCSNTAKKVYSIAHDYLTTEKRAGTLEDFNRLSSHFGGVVNLDQQEQMLKSVYSGYDFDSFITDYKKRYREVPIRYLLLPSQDASGDEREENPVLEILDYQLPDDNIKKNTILIEYNGNTGEVLGVLYSEKADVLIYEGNTKDKSNAILRDVNSLEKKWQGYYGLNPEDL